MWLHTIFHWTAIFIELTYIYDSFFNLYAFIHPFFGEKISSILIGQKVNIQKPSNREKNTQTNSKIEKTKDEISKLIQSVKLDRHSFVFVFNSQNNLRHFNKRNQQKTTRKLILEQKRINSCILEYLYCDSRMNFNK